MLGMEGSLELLCWRLNLLHKEASAMAQTFRRGSKKRKEWEGLAQRAMAIQEEGMKGWETKAEGKKLDEKVDKLEEEIDEKKAGGDGGEQGEEDAFFELPVPPRSPSPKEVGAVEGGHGGDGVLKGILKADDHIPVYSKTVSFDLTELSLEDEDVEEVARPDRSSPPPIRRSQRIGGRSQVQLGLSSKAKISI